MTMLSTIETGIHPRPRRVLLYGVHGIGKSTFGSMAEDAIFIQTEDGLGDIDCARFPVATKYEDVLAAIKELRSGEHGFKTVVIDSLDWLERMIFVEVVENWKVKIKSIEDIGYAKGYTFALIQWREILEGLDALRRDRGMQVILIAHSAIERFNDPANEPYDRYAPKLNKHASALIQEWCDEVLFANYWVSTVTTDEGFKKTRVKGIGKGERVLKTTERPAHMAKNRLNLPDEIPLDYRVYAAFARGENPLAPIEVEVPVAEPQTQGA